MEENKKSGLKLNGAPWYIALGCILIILASAYLGVLGTDMASVLALCVAIAVIFNEIGERLPIWNSYIGGGLLMVFFGTAVLVQFNLIPEKYVEGINTFISGDTGFLTFFIIFLIAGSILSLERDILLKSFAGIHTRHPGRPGLLHDFWSSDRTCVWNRPLGYPDQVCASHHGRGQRSRSGSAVADL